uniref:Uncharacterized protein n=1 Tax=Ananas comosus var. bracteatus TaxID=296719 RepID=A0A6V7QLS1_ANACO|nr:unnamed protein product [Ananas comosus var. bracteatus]
MAILKLHGKLLKSLEPIFNDCTDENWKDFMNCLGALDGTFIKLKVPAKDKARPSKWSSSSSSNDAPPTLFPATPPPPTNPNPIVVLLFLLSPSSTATPQSSPPFLWSRPHSELPPPIAEILLGLSRRRGDDDDGTWKLSPEFDEVDSVFGDIAEGGEEVFVSEAVEDVVKGFTGGSGDPWAKGAAVDREDEETDDVFGAEETEEAEKDVAYEKQKLEEREKELLETLKGFGKVPGYEHVFTDFLLSQVQSKYKRRLANS